MKELWRRLLARPALATELAVGSMFINLLALAQPLFVMQVLNRYVAHGVDATLATLTTGALIAVAMEFAFRQARLSIARGISAGPDEKIAIEGFDALTQAKTAALDQLPPEARREVVGGAAAIESAYSASNVATILDVPFSVFFVFVLYILSPMLSLIVGSVLAAVFALGVFGSLSMQEKTAETQRLSGMGSALMSTATREGDTIRCFNAGNFMRQAWRKHLAITQKLRHEVAGRQAMIQNVTQSATALMSIAVVAVGAVLVVVGELDVGAMMGANILSARALQPIARFSQLGSAFAKAHQSLEIFAKLANTPREPHSGSALRTYSGRVEFRDLAFAFLGNASPLFESLSLQLDPGKVLVVTGANSTGKTTFARLVMGLLDPVRGQILVDGLDLKQVAPEWWRRQVVFLPQEPSLLNATIEENLKINNPEIDNAALNQIIDACGLRKFIDETQKGLETPVVDNGWRLSEGIRRRLALARALATDGMLVVIDEPMESLDAAGCETMLQVIGALAKRGRTIIIFSHQREIVRGGHLLLDLNVKPIPTVAEVPAKIAAVASAKDGAATMGARHAAV